MNILKKTVTETPDSGLLRRLLGKTIEWGELIVILAIALFLAKMLSSAVGIG